MSDIKTTIVNITKNVKKTGGEMIKTTKLNFTLAQEETNLKNLYIEIGKKVHEIYEFGGSLGKFFDEKYTEIVSIELKMAELKEQISIIKGVKQCPKCGKTVERVAEFCPKCGVQVVDVIRSDPEPASQPAHEDIEPIPNSNNSNNSNNSKSLVCRICNTQNEDGTKFCLNCGRMLD